MCEIFVYFIFLLTDDYFVNFWRGLDFFYLFKEAHYRGLRNTVTMISLSIIYLMFPESYFTITLIFIWSATVPNVNTQYLL